VLLLAAGQLLAERGERLVGGEGTAAAATFAALRLLGVVRLRAGRLGLGATRLFDLLLVGVEAGAGLGVLPLPGLPLLVEALEPVAGLRVEALGVLVVPLLVVLG